MAGQAAGAVFAASTGRDAAPAGRGDVDRFREAIAPIHEAGKLGARR